MSSTPSIDRRDPPITEELVDEGLTIHVSRQHCVDAMGPDEAGRYRYWYEFDLFAFSHDEVTLHGRAYSDEPKNAHLLAIEVNGHRDTLSPSDLERPLARAAIRYLRRAGRTELTWLDASDTGRGYTPIP